MKQLNNEDLQQVNGGGIILAVNKWAITGAIATFIIGFINGYQRPLTCSSTK